MSVFDHDQEQGGIEAPLVIVFAGPNGSGKSTINDRILKDPGMNFQGEYINADDIARTLEKDIPDYRSRNIKAAVIADQRRAKAIEEGRPFAFETVMSTPEKVAIMTQAKAKGYEVALMFVTTDDPELNVRRVEDRVKKGLHSVDPDAIRRRYHSAMSLLPCAVEHADAALVIDNSAGKPVDVARKAQGHLIPMVQSPPQWVSEQLLNPYKERVRSREQIEDAYQKHCAANAHAGSLRVVLKEADASHGKTYSGKIIEVTTHHALQQIGANQLIIHDRSLSAAQPLRCGMQATIGYAYDRGKIIAPNVEKATGRGIQR